MKTLLEETIGLFDLTTEGNVDFPKAYSPRRLALKTLLEKGPATKEQFEAYIHQKLLGLGMMEEAKLTRKRGAPANHECYCPSALGYAKVFSDDPKWGSKITFDEKEGDGWDSYTRLADGLLDRVIGQLLTVDDSSVRDTAFVFGEYYSFARDRCC
ncbi:MAG TPA: hypothetical protein VN420_01085 [Candidatus Fimivivens sp.]|nr:hypothetical protein [Candidatus Fimivivens sp.]